MVTDVPIRARLSLGDADGGRPGSRQGAGGHPRQSSDSAEGYGAGNAEMEAEVDRDDVPSESGFHWGTVDHLVFTDEQTVAGTGSVDDVAEKDGAAQRRDRSAAMRSRSAY